MSGLNGSPTSRIRCRLSGRSQIAEASLAAFGEAFDAQLLPYELGGMHLEPVVVIGDDGDDVLKSYCPPRAFVAPAEHPTQGEGIDRIEICGAIPGKPWLRHQSLMLPKGTRIAPLKAPVGSEVLARSKVSPVWVREKVGEGIVDRVAWPLPMPAPDRPVYEWINSETLPQLLPLIQFVREVTGEHRWNSQLKACFMFDDPNLHAGSYGFIRYKELAAQARRFRYHVSFATIPLDAWFVSSKAAALFRDSKTHLSLLVHGNDHLHQELAQDYRNGERLALLGQALRRIQQLETRSGVEVCRVMAAPHGACAEDMMRDMARFGFEAACISHGSLRSCNRERDWSKTVGSRPAEMIAGLPIIPRFPIAADNLQKVLLAAFLDQPIIPMGHHQDMAFGLDLLNGLAEQINRLGQVHWTRMSEIAKTCFQWRMEGETFVVRSYSRLARISVPENATRLTVESPRRNSLSPVRYSMMRAADVRCDLEASESVAVTPGETVWLKPAAGECVDPNSVSPPKLKVWPILRRAASEARDRLTPWLPRF